MSINEIVDRLFMKDAGFAFTDIVSGKSVRYYIDRNGVKWMKDGRFSLFAVKSNSD